ncbi:hypothetical protein L202_05558 [Cryptococcus amylolentus CBS 6039]|uniref:DNA topoisomerase (ATP-hydrolyzing) n=2 Tax=Cryptococcus amylolentus TaxID=104669 RepID=A0A1E3HNI1_9TREE|nr:hypothetical protein L202_05558 [Cryptococcus amylolentus CBS 6039]ODN77011.1 hypothetical protein L202_05558 [Cryptococcus amylolentus CBS 6039]ODO04877.1 hypothetical protein I350_05487 [Cryptococcus amylolentus CBS 6273]
MSLDAPPVSPDGPSLRTLPSLTLSDPPAHRSRLPDGNIPSHDDRPRLGSSRGDWIESSGDGQLGAVMGRDAGYRHLEGPSPPCDGHLIVSDDAEIDENEGESQEAIFEQLMLRREALLNPVIPQRETPVATGIDLDIDEEEQEQEDTEEQQKATEMDIDMVYFYDSMEERESRGIRGLNFLQTLATSCIDQLAAVIEEDTQGYLSNDGEDTTSESNITDDETRDGGGLSMALSLQNRKTGALQVYSYPDSPELDLDRQGALHKLTCILRVASVMMEALLEKTVITLRDIFYRDKKLFGKQSVVDKIADDIVATAELHRADFYIGGSYLCASAKGLIAATDLVIHCISGQNLHLSPRHATLIEPVEKIQQLRAPLGLEWILVVEKDAVFQSLLSAGLLEDERLGPGVIITGKGFPDLSTRQLARRLVDTMPDARIFGLFDADPHGLNILSNYTYGSKANLHSTEHEGLALGERLEWIGLKASEWEKLGINYDDLLPFETSDDSLAVSMLRDHERLPAAWKSELCRMLHLRRKAEIEIVIGAQGNADHQENGNVMNEDTGSGVAKLVDWIVGKIGVS